MPKINILAIDTSCDDTSVAVLQNDRVLANIVSSQIDIHKEWGGIVPNLARREHERMIDGCVNSALKRSGIKKFSALQAIAVTYGPGLAPALQVGVARAKELALQNKLPLIAVNHMEGHILSVFLKNSKGKYYSGVDKMKFPLMGMSISGGHTEIVWAKKLGDYCLLGQTLDDAAGEAFDKVARMLDLGYPGGQVISHLAKKGNEHKYDLPRPMKNKPNYDFSFSGLKTACLYNTNDLKKQLKTKFAQIIPDYCASFQAAVIESLLVKLIRAARAYQPKMVVIGGGVSANTKLRSQFRSAFKKIGIPVYFPGKKMCTDNAAMIGLVAFHKYKKQEFIKNIPKLDRDPSLVFKQCISRK